VSAFPCQTYDRTIVSVGIESEGGRGLVIAGSAMTRFGRHPEAGPVELAVQAAREAIDSAGLSPADVDTLYLGTFLGQSLHQQGVVASIVARRLGLGPVPTSVVEGTCASGGIALRHGVLSCRSGSAETALCVGVEHLTGFSTEAVTGGLAEAFELGGDRGSGLTFPGFFGLVASEHQARYGTDREEMAAVTVKNRAHAEGSPIAMFDAPVSVEQVVSSRPIADPLCLYDCSPISDGAAAVVVTTRANAAGARERPVRIRACEQASGATAISQVADLTTFEATTAAAGRAFAAAGVAPEELDVVELHDCFSIAEIVDCEDLGLLPRGEAPSAIADGATSFGGSRAVVNPSGGLLSRGHPVGATGLAQINELVRQLRGVAHRQVEGAALALAHNLGGTGATATVTVLAR
jgi:acetyl-CoA C-acetyltransferase